MGKLVKSELYKIFHNKSIYIVLGLIICFVVGIYSLERILNGSEDTENEDSDSTSTVDKSYYEEIQKNADLNTENGKKNYAYAKSQIEEQELINKYGNNSWQKAIIKNKVNDLLQVIDIYEATGKTFFEEYNDSYYNLGVYSEADINMDNLKEEYNNMLQKLDNNDWQSFEKENVEEYKNRVKVLESSKDQALNQFDRAQIQKSIDKLNLQIEVANERINRNISYTDKLNNKFDKWQNNEEQIIEANYKYNVDENNYMNNDKMKYEEKVNYQSNLENVNVSKYEIENSDKNIEELDQTPFGLSFNIIILLAIIMIVGAIVSKEFEKGTVKNLLLKPYSRRKIIISKYIAAIIASIVIFAVVALTTVITVQVLYSVHANAEIIQFDYTNNTVYLLNAKLAFLKQLVLSAVPMLLVFLTIAFTISTITSNTAVSIIIPIIVYFSSTIVGELVMRKPWAKYLPSFNWDITKLLPGQLPSIQGLDLKIAVIENIAIIVMLLIISVEYFKNKDVKNI